MLGGLISGIIVYTLAPEAEGHGTDAALDAIHNRWGRARLRTPFVKIIASAVTIGSGGSGGREGPIVQSGASLGYHIGRLLKMGRMGSRLLSIAGAAAGIGAIFRTPLGGALFGVEVLYKRDFEATAIMYTLISSITGYIVFSSVMGYESIFIAPSGTPNPRLAGLSIVIGVVAAFVAKYYIRVFYKLIDIFRRLPLMPHVKPAIGGLITGLIAVAVWYVNPSITEGVVSTGYQAVQAALQQVFPWYVLLAIALLKPLATGFTIGSGGSAGVFGPSVVIGATLGVGISAVISSLVHIPQSQVEFAGIIGISAFIAATCKTPLASIIMASEMTRGYTIMPYAAIAAVLAYILSGSESIYSRQIESRERSPAYMLAGYPV